MSQSDFFLCVDAIIDTARRRQRATGDRPESIRVSIGMRRILLEPPLPTYSNHSNDWIWPKKMFVADMEVIEDKNLKGVACLAS